MQYERGNYIKYNINIIYCEVIRLIEACCYYFNLLSMKSRQISHARLFNYKYRILVNTNIIYLRIIHD
jgi:hypothetical protein